MNYENNHASLPHDDVRQRLVRQALHLFIERGYAATSVREIVAAAGVTKPVLYYYFKSKEGLYLEIMGEIGRQFDQRVAEIGTAGGTVGERLNHLFRAMFTSALENLPVVKLAYSIYFGPPQGAPYVDFNRFFDAMLLLVNDLIDQGINRGELKECNREALAWSLVGSYHTILEEQICRPVPRVSLEGLIATINLIIDGVSLPGGVEQ